MALSKSLALAVAVSVLASGCVFLDRGAKWPTLQMPQEKPAEQPAPSPAPPPPPSAGATGNAISKTLDSLQARLDLHANDLSSTEAMIEDQRGRYKTALEEAKSGASGPEDRWNMSEIELTRLASDVARLGDLDDTLAQDSARLAEAYAAAQELEKNTGADQPLTARTGEMIARTGMMLDTVRTRRAEDDRYVESERRTLADLRPETAPPSVPSLPADREAYVVYHLDQDDTGYEATLRDAIKQALARRPDMTFDLYTLTGSAEDDVKAQDRAEDVERILHSMKVSADHINLTAIHRSQATPPELRIYVR